MRRHVLILLSVLALAGCASTKITSQWADPGLGTTRLDRIMVAFQHKDVALRRSLEDAMAQAIPNSTPAYRMIDDAEIRDVKRVAEKLKASGYDAVVVMRVVSLEKESRYVPGTMHMGPAPYSRMSRGWSYGWTQVYEPGYLRTDKIVTVGTNVYSIGDEKLVWASRSETFNPGDTAKLVREVVAANAEAARKVMRK